MKILARCPIHREASECWWEISDSEGVELFTGHLRRHGGDEIVDALETMRERYRTEIDPFRIVEPDPALRVLWENPLEIEMIPDE